VLFNCSLYHLLVHNKTLNKIHNGINHSLNLPPLAGHSNQTYHLLPHHQCPHLLPHIHQFVALLPPPTHQLTLSLTAHIKKYTPDHEWIELSSDSKTGTIGISTYAANALGDVVFVELPTVSLEVSRNDTIGSVESVKSASDIMTPVSGIITEANAVLEEKPSMINKSPEGEGWIAKIEVKDVKEIEGLMDEVAYKKFTEESEE
jgi:glycine cleavage system H protein